jgi:hypothetical protein
MEREKEVKKAQNNLHIEKEVIGKKSFGEQGI